ncbi:MAG: phosphonopyruvate decarboxylase [Treponema sp.]|jgi:phosphonopyruvate decarboxylase|nr:phosphonopyruvate decarboxylase [Treponema sp.]
MIEPRFFYETLVSRGTDFFTGVPDSLLKHFCAYITDHAADECHIIAVNEGAAVALAAGYHLATNKTPLVYMQNSGIGNAVNPLLSLADPDVYRMPLVLVIGWRGQPGVHDEPQHVKQGKVTDTLLDAMGIPYVLMADTETALSEQIELCYEKIAETSGQFAFVVPKGVFTPYSLQKKQDIEAEMTREEAIEEIAIASGKDEIFVSTTGMASRELYEIRDKHREGHERDFLTVGSMGHASHIALGIALQKPCVSVIILDGDGAVLMHMGALAALGAENPRNIRHIVLNNRAHDSVGGQPTIAGSVDLCGVALSCGYRRVYRVETRDALRKVLSTGDRELTFIEISVKKGARHDLGRPRSTPEENKTALMRFMDARGEKID